MTESAKQAVTRKLSVVYFKNEITLLKNVKVILALGAIAFKACINLYKQDYQIKNSDYHPSNQDIKFM